MLLSSKNLQGGPKTIIAIDSTPYLLQDWFAKKNSITHHDGTLIESTEQALWIQFPEYDVWIPKSLLKPIETGTLNQFTT